MNRNWLTIALACSGAIALIAQPPPPGGMHHGGPGGPQGFGGPGFGRDMKVVKGQPYTAEVSSQTTQVLSDGTKITRSMTGVVYRDAEGRTRREETNAQGEKRIDIFDPVAGFAIHLDPATKTASRQQVHTPPAGGGPAHARQMHTSRDSADHPNRNGANHVTEDLGTKSAEALVLQGHRTTRTIAAGTMGNDKDIKVIDEVWTDSTLQVTGQSHHSDPWTGDVTYKLSNVQRGDPSAALFQAPADYQIKDMKFGHGPGPGPSTPVQQ